MNWTYPPGANDAGVYEIGRRLAVELGRMPDATSFTYDARQMMRITRRIESAARGGTLLTGFQSAAKFDVESLRYHELVDAGTEVTVFATGQPSQELGGVEYREVAPGTRRLENQWFLVSRSPKPVAFVSWELGDPGLFGIGGATTEGKHFVGFVSDDPEVVEILVNELTGIEGIAPSSKQAKSQAPAPAPDPQALAIIAEVERTNAPSSGAPAGAVVVPIGRGNSRHALDLAIAIAKAEARPLVLVDRSGEGLFSSPYAAVRADDELRPKRDELFNASIARREGRAETAAAITAAELLGVTAGGWFPTSSGIDGLKEALRQFAGSLLVVPGSAQKPGIGERIRGMTMDSLRSLGVPLIVAD